MRNVASFSTSLNFEPLAFESAARYLNVETNYLCMNDCPMTSPSLVKLGAGPRSPENRLSVVPNPKIVRRKRARSSITQRRVIPFRSNFVQSLNTTPEVL